MRNTCVIGLITPHKKQKFQQFSPSNVVCQTIYVFTNYSLRYYRISKRIKFYPPNPFRKL